MFDGDWNYIDHISYTNLRSDKIRAYHSGDVVDGGDFGGNGVSEFIDINVIEAQEICRYVVFQVYSYSEDRFDTIDHCRFGWMGREDVDSGEIYEPATVAVNMDITAKSTNAIPVIYDCFSNEFVWCDMAVDTTLCHDTKPNNLENNLTGVRKACFAMVELNRIRPSLNQLIILNEIARDGVEASREEADIIFSNDTTIPINKETGEEKKDVKIITTFDTDYFVGELL